MLVPVTLNVKDGGRIRKIRKYVEHNDFIMVDGKEVPNHDTLNLDDIPEEENLYRGDDGFFYEDLEEIEVIDGVECVVRPRRHKRAAEDEVEERDAKRVKTDITWEREFVPPEPKTVLFTLVEQMSKLDHDYLEKYDEWLEAPAKRDQLLPFLREEVYEMFKPEVQGERWGELLRALGGDLGWDGPAIYMHLISLNGQVRLYVGQAFNTKRRLSQHTRDAHRERAPSVHYKALERSDWDKFVILAYLPKTFVPQGTTDDDDDAEVTHEELSLNVMEMWCACLFQTLPRQTLHEYLPSLEVTSPEIHLNVSPPLSQGFSARYGLGHLYHSADPLLRDYARNALEKATVESARARRERLDARIREGAEFSVNSSTKQFRVRIRYAELTLPKNVILQDNGKVWVDTEVSEPGTVHPNAACVNALEGDPAQRLAFRVKVTDDMGEPREHWLSTKGKKDVLKCNTIVDYLEGVSQEVIENTPRRVFRPGASGKYQYTAGSF